MKLSFNRSAVWGAWSGAAGILIAGCAPEVQIRAPEKPIVINLNFKIEQEIRVKVEKEIDDLLLKNKDLF